jgi:uncharacterized protein YjbI with pentapeptide repeats
MSGCLRTPRVTDSAAKPYLDRLSRCELEELLADAKGGWVDLRGFDLTGLVLSNKVPLKRVLFGRHDAKVERPAARLYNTSFRQCTLVECKFAEVECVGTDFRGARLTNCDFRYASFTRVTFADATLELSATSTGRCLRKEWCIERTVLDGVSLHQASLGGIVGLRLRDSFPAAQRPGAGARRRGPVLRAT